MHTVNLITNKVPAAVKAADNGKLSAKSKAAFKREHEISIKDLGDQQKPYEPTSKWLSEVLGLGLTADPANASSAKQSKPKAKAKVKSA